MKKNPQEEQLPDLGRFPAQRRRRGPVEPDLGKIPMTCRPGRYKGHATDSPAPEPLGADDEVVIVDSASNTPSKPEKPAAPQSVQPGQRAPGTATIQQPPTQGQPTVTPSTTEKPAATPGPSVQKPPEQQQAQRQQSAAPAPFSQATTQTVAPPSERKNMWPEAKRLELAEAACDYINSLNTNASKPQCQPPFIMSLIERNPTYIEICGLIESSGYHINRVHFARHLLKSVPDLTGNTAQNQNATPASQQPAPVASHSRPLLPAPQRAERIPPSGQVPESMPVPGPPAQQPLPWKPPQIQQPPQEQPPQLQQPSQPQQPPQVPQPPQLQQSPPANVPSQKPVQRPHPFGALGQPILGPVGPQQKPAPTSQPEHTEASALLQQFQKSTPKQKQPTEQNDDSAPIVVDDDLPPSPGPAPPSSTTTSEPPPNAAVLNGAPATSQPFIPPYTAPAAPAGRGTLMPAPSPGFQGVNLRIPEYTGKPLFGTLIPPNGRTPWVPIAAKAAPVFQSVPPPSGSPGVRFLPVNSQPPPGRPRHVSESGPIRPPAWSPPAADQHGPKPVAKLAPKLRVPAPPPHKPAPGSKEEKARKRNFGDIVDLSMLSDEDEQPSLKSPRVESTDELSRVQTLENTPAPVSEEASVQPEAPQVDTSKQKSTSKKASSRQSDIVKPINKARALRKSYYDPRTIARDVLIASGRHPTERGLNHHLSKLREKFSAVDFNSDLETFRWDTVDPGGPAPPEVQPVPLLTRPQPPAKSQAQTGQTGLPQLSPRDPSQSAGAASSSSSSHPSRSRPTKKPSRLRTSHVAEHADTPERYSPLLNMSLGGSSSSHRVRKPLARTSSTFTSASTPARTSASCYPQVQVVITNMPRPKSSSFAVYDCRWQHCGAKLHNLETLRKHLLRVHGAADEGADEAAIVCLWNGCRDKTKTWDREAMRAHLKGHVSEVAWVKGEGPRATPRGTPQDESGENSNMNMHSVPDDADTLRPTGGSVASPIVIV